MLVLLAYEELKLLWSGTVLVEFCAAAFLMPAEESVEDAVAVAVLEICVMADFTVGSPVAVAASVFVDVLVIKICCAKSRLLFFSPTTLALLPSERSEGKRLLPLSS